MVEWQTIVMQWGWAGVLLWIVVEKVGPAVRDVVVPERAAARRRREKTEEQEWARLKSLEERQVAAFEKVAEGMTQLVENYLLISERMGRVESGVDRLLEQRPTPTLPKGRERRKGNADQV